MADEIGRTLRADGFEAVGLPADTVSDVSGYDRVVLGGAFYAGHWNGEACRCARRNAEQLRHRPVWFFSSGPIDSSAEQHDIPAWPAGRRNSAPGGTWPSGAPWPPRACGAPVPRQIVNSPPTATGCGRPPPGRPRTRPPPPGTGRHRVRSHPRSGNSPTTSVGPAPSTSLPGRPGIAR
ncbi:flavodoxin domain-containing protein [Streptomyces sp. NPDC057854]|uniref:flavodoxin domain-containing protein n=1 Tax=unclassified Streptomyces TaxID=2593676 RepID=UPI0036B53657